MSTILFTYADYQKAYIDTIHHELHLALGRDNRRLEDAVNAVARWPITANADGTIDMRVLLLAYVDDREFAWCEYFIPEHALEYGIDIRHRDVKRGMHGAFINHGTEDDPKWSSHT